MARIKIDLPDSFSFACSIKVRITDLNYGNHVGNDAILGYLHESRVQYLNHLGYKSEVDIEGVGLIQADAAIVYKSEAFYGDILQVEIAANDFTKYGFDLVYKITHADTKKEVARGKTGLVCFDYNIRKIALLPSTFQERLQQ